MTALWVRGAGNVRLRRAGPFRLGIAEIRVQKSTDVARAHEVVHKLERTVRAEMPNVEMLTMHLEPFQPAEQTAMAPADGLALDANVSEHFGRAKCFVFAAVTGEDVRQRECVENTFRGQKARAALAASKSVLADQKTDAVVTREIGEIAFHTLRDHYVTIHCAPPGAVAEALAQFAGGKLSPLTAPTHASGAAGAPTNPARAEQENRP